MNVIILFIFLVFQFTTEYPDQDSLSAIVDKPEYFPNSINNQWIYEISDLYGNTIDTVIVTIIGEKTISEKNYKVWEYDYGNDKYLLYCSIDNDTVKIISPLNYEVMQIFVIPFEFEFELDSPWNNSESNYVIDRTTVINIQDIIIDSIRYSEAIYMVRKRVGTNDIYTEKIWFKPFLGILKMSTSQGSFGLGNNESWKLIEYNIK